MERELTAWLVRYGPPLLFAAQVLGLFGLPIPDEFLLTLAGALIAAGTLSGPWTASAAVAGCLTGITLSYILGRSVGLPVLRKLAGRHLDVLETAQAWFRRFGGWLLAFGYFVPGVRHVTAIAAGSGCLSYPRFAVWAYPGGVVWCAVFLGLGYYAGGRWREVLEAARHHLTSAAAVIAIAAMGYVVFRAAGRRRAHP